MVCFFQVINAMGTVLINPENRRGFFTRILKLVLVLLWLGIFKNFLWGGEEDYILLNHNEFIPRFLPKHLLTSYLNIFNIVQFLLIYGYIYHGILQEDR